MPDLIETETRRSPACRTDGASCNCDCAPAKARGSHWPGTWLLLLIALAAVASLTGCGGAETASPGEAVYARVCASCHQNDGYGLPPSFPPLVNSAWTKGDPDALVRIVLHGLRGPIVVDGMEYNGLMAGWGRQLSDEEIADVLTYVRETFADSASAVTPAQVADVRAATEGRRRAWVVEELNAPR